MRDVNKVILIGRLGKDPEIVNFDSGTKKASFTLATGESYTNKNGERVENTEWHNIVMWRKQAEIAEQYLKKGAPVYIEGKIRSRSYDDKEGNRRYITEIEVDNFSMLGSRTEHSSSQPHQTQVKETAKKEKTEENINFNDGLPF